MFHAVRSPVSDEDKLHLQLLGPRTSGVLPSRYFSCLRGTVLPRAPYAGLMLVLWLPCLWAHHLHLEPDRVELQTKDSNCSEPWMAAESFKAPRFLQAHL